MTLTSIVFLLVAIAMGYGAVVDHNPSSWLLCAFCAYAGLDLLWHEITVWRLRRAARPHCPHDKPGWRCKRGRPHEGSCPMVPVGLNRLYVWLRFRWFDFEDWLEERRRPAKPVDCNRGNRCPWTEESAENGWRSQCAACGLFASGSCQG